MISNEKKQAEAEAEDNDEELTEEELADISAGAGAVVPRKVGDAAMIQKTWIVHPDGSSSVVKKKEE